MTEERIARLNELARKSKTIGLTEEEKQEQALLRQEYLAAIRQSLEAQLDNVYIVEKDGTQTKLKKKGQGPLSYPPSKPPSGVLYGGPAAQYKEETLPCPVCTSTFPVWNRRPKTPWWPSSMTPPPPF